jgi:hypothetical protein
MKKRCANPNASSYKWYGGKGIKVCKKWLKYEEFKEWAMANGHEDDLTIDRLKTVKGYSPGNCQWIPFKDNLEKRNGPSRKLTFKQATEVRASKLSQDKLAEKYGVTQRVISLIIRFKTYKRDYINGIL